MTKYPLGLKTCAIARKMLNSDMSIFKVHAFLLAHGFNDKRAQAFYSF